MKIVVIGFTVVLIVLSCGLAIRYNQDAGSARHDLDGERYKRMVLEERLQKADQDILSLNSNLERALNKVENITFVFKNTKAMNVDLRSRLDKASIIQTSLDKRISELLQLVSPL